MKTAPEHLPDDPALLKQLLAEREATISQLQAKVNWLEEQFRLGQHRRFGASSEAFPAQGELFNEAEVGVEETSAEPETASLATTRKQPGRKPLPKELPRIRVEYDLPNEAKVCGCCGDPLHRIGEETTEQLEIVPAKVRVLQNVRFKYGCRQCEQQGTEAKVVTSPMPRQPIPGSLASPATLAAVVTSKYCDALPLYRQAAILARGGIELSRTTLAHWCIRAGTLIRPLYQAMRQQLLTEPILHADETGVQVIKEPGRAAQSQSYMWVYRTAADSPHPLVLYDYRPGRGHEYPTAFLDGFAGYLQVDGYGAYASLPDVTLIGCWAHARRKFDEAQKAAPKKTGRARHALSQIQKLYQVERQAQTMTPEQRRSYRQEHARPVLETFRDWLERTLQQVPPKSVLGKAVGYALNQWDKLVRYLEDGRLAIDNNLVERDIRPFTTGRKNWLFSHTPQGAEASALLYSLALSARANALNPYDYFRTLFTELPQRSEGADLTDLLPGNVQLDQE